LKARLSLIDEFVGRLVPRYLRIVAVATCAIEQSHSQTCEDGHLDRVGVDDGS